VVVEALEALGALAGFPAGRAALQRAGLPALLGAALWGGWLEGRAVGLARGLRDELLQGAPGRGRGGGGAPAAAAAPEPDPEPAAAAPRG
jgi:hypothetical protein